MFAFLVIVIVISLSLDVIITVAIDVSTLAELCYIVEVWCSLLCICVGLLPNNRKKHLCIYFGITKAFPVQRSGDSFQYTQREN